MHRETLPSCIRAQSTAVSVFRAGRNAGLCGRNPTIRRGIARRHYLSRRDDRARSRFWHAGVYRGRQAGAVERFAARCRQSSDRRSRRGSRRPHGDQRLAGSASQSGSDSVPPVIAAHNCRERQLNAPDQDRLWRRQAARETARQESNLKDSGEGGARRKVEGTVEFSGCRACCRSRMTTPGSGYSTRRANRRDIAIEHQWPTAARQIHVAVARLRHRELPQQSRSGRSSDRDAQVAGKNCR